MSVGSSDVYGASMSEITIDILPSDPEGPVGHELIHGLIGAVIAAGDPSDQTVIVREVLSELRGEEAVMKALVHAVIRASEIASDLLGTVVIWKMRENDPAFDDDAIDVEAFAEGRIAAWHAHLGTKPRYTDPER